MGIRIDKDLNALIELNSRWELTSIGVIGEWSVINEHGVRSVSGGHSELIASQNIPSSAIELPSAISVLEVSTVRT
jgi:hypothetical protein